MEQAIELMGSRSDVAYQDLEFLKIGDSYVIRPSKIFIDQLVAEEVGKKQLSLFTQEEWDLLVDAVAYHSTCKECDMVKNQDLLEKVAVYQEKLQKLQSGELK